MLRGTLPAIALAALLTVGARTGVQARATPHAPAHGIFARPSDGAITTPNPNELLAQATQALRATRTFHYVGDAHVQLVGGLGSITMHEVGDVDLKHQTARRQDKGTIANFGEVQNVDERGIQVKSKLWYKSKSTKNKWNAGTGVTGTPLDFKHLSLRSQTALKGFRLSSLTLTSVSPEQLSGVAVWHVHGDFTVQPFASSSPLPGIVDYYIRQQGTMPVLLKITWNDTPDSVLEILQEAFSHFGEGLSIRAPN